MATPPKEFDRKDPLRPDINFEDVPERSFLQRRMDQPFVTAGVLAAVGMLAHGAYGYKRRGTLPTSFYLLELRVRTQAMIVGALMVGISVNLYKDIFGSDDKKK